LGGCSGYGSWAETAGSGGAAGTPAAGGSAGADAGVGGSSDQPVVTAGSGGGGGAGGTPNPVFASCPDDGRDTAELVQPNVQRAALDTLDAGTADVADATDTSDASDAQAPSGPEFHLSGLVGWAAEAGAGVATTTGGAAGRVVTAHSAAELESFARSDEPLVIRICGTLRAPSVQVASNKTLVGVGSNPTLEGGLAIRGTPGAFVQNVVVKNLRVNAAFSAVDGVGVMVDKAHHVWIDHGEFFDAVGGLLHVVHAADYVSVSWTKFHFTPDTPDVEHRFGCMIGNSDDDQVEDTGHLRVTLHHNWWADYIRQRAPRVRFGDVHLFNNYYSTAGNDYSIWAALGSRVLLENNYFHGVTNPHELHDPDAQLLARDNIYDGTSGPAQSTGTAFVPPYAYSAEPALGLGSVVQQGAGLTP
ncbi:MAG TPA: hypothetical protein VMG12_16000, partial [Polyangiaceae bacterium]|nr:hypothetical protein [Polyangiaceae bacterium]